MQGRDAMRFRDGFIFPHTTHGALSFGGVSLMRSARTAPATDDSLSTRPCIQPKVFSGSFSQQTVNRLMNYTAAKQHVANRGVPPTGFLDQLVTWARNAPDEIFEPNHFSDIYSSVRNTLGPWEGIPHRRAAMLEVMRVLAGFESSWDWNEGRDTSNPDSDTPETIEAGAWQVSANSTNFGQELKDLVRSKVGTLDGNAFQRAMKQNHPLAMEYVARLLRRTTRHHGPVREHLIDAWLRRDAVAEFQALVGSEQRGGGQVDLHPPNGRNEIQQMFGKPNNNDGTLNEAWESQNIRHVTPPTGWQLYYQDDDHGPVPVSSIRIHRKLEESFRSVLTAVWNHAQVQLGGTPSDSAIRQWLHERRLDQHSGGFNFRSIHGTSRLSLHSYGIAIDWDADHNPQGHSTHSLPDWWYDIWRNNGWSDGRHFSNPDPMHVQFAAGA
jgi:hypothetical protein